MSADVQTRFQVTGMTCGHCVASVTEELTDAVAGATVEIDLPTGQVVLTSPQPVAVEIIEAAVREAGYHVAPGTLQ